MGGLYREPHDLSCIQIDNSGDVDNLVPEVHMGEVRGPYVMRIRGTGLHEQIRVDHLDIPCLFPSSAPSAICLDAKEIHYPFYAFAVEVELDSEPSGTVARVDTERFFNPAFQVPIFIRLLGLVIQHSSVHTKLSYTKSFRCLTFAHDFFFWDSESFSVSHPRA